MKQTTRNRIIAATLALLLIGAAAAAYFGIGGETISVRMADGGTFRTVGKVAYRNGAAVISVRKHTEMRTETKADTVRQIPMLVKRHQVIIPAERIIYLTVE